MYGTGADGADMQDHVVFNSAMKSCFERKSEDHFDIELADVGQIYKIRIGHDNSGWQRRRKKKQ